MSHTQKALGSEHSGSSNSIVLTSETSSRVQTSSESSDVCSDTETAFVDNSTEQQKTIDNEECVDEQQADPSTSDSGKNDENDAEVVEVLPEQQKHNEPTIECDAIESNGAVVSSECEAETPSIPTPSNIDASVNEDIDDKESDNGEAIKSDIGEAIKSDDAVNDDNDVEVDEEAHKLADELEAIRYEHLKIVHNGRDVLDFESNVARSWIIPATHLPEHNIKMFMANRSQYHRLTPAWAEAADHPMVNCGKCDFKYPAYEPSEKQQPPCIPSDSASLAGLMNTLTVNSGAAAPGAPIQSNLSPSLTSANNNAMNGNWPMGPMPNRNSPINTIKGEY